MKIVSLHTAKGELVTNVLIPPFIPGYDPEVIIWGERFFKKDDYNKYLECFVIVAFTKEEWKNNLGVQ